MPATRKPAIGFRFLTFLGIGALLAAASGSGIAAATAETDLRPVGTRSAAEQRTESDPTLVKVPTPPARASIPQDRYAMAGGCYVLGSSDGSWLAKQGDGYEFATESARAAAPIHFQATELGVYLLFDTDKQFVTHTGKAVGAPSPQTEWEVTKHGNSFQFTNGGAALKAGEDGALTSGDGSKFTLQRTTGCSPWPEAEVNVTGAPFAGISPLQEVRGYLDDHIHHMTQDFLGGGIHCGKPWDKYGVEYALKDCADHIATGGKLALPEIILSGKTEHDPTGWPTFKDWPAHDSLTHEGTYYKWVERAWRGGQRLFVNLLVENSVLCAVYPGPNKPFPGKPNCTDMDSIRTQAKQTREFENYVDAQWGGPGKGWYRVVDSPRDARRVINEGKMAVVLGTESSSLFGCTTLVDQPQCTEAEVDAGLDELHELGIRQMVPTHKFDNAFSGTKGDEGFNGVATNAGNFLQNGSFLGMQTCKETEPADNEQLNASAIPEENLANISQLFGPLAGLSLPLALPLYPAGPHCNHRGFTKMGKYMLQQMVERNIIFDVDHMSGKGRQGALDELERLEYSGVISSHSWADPQALPRIYGLGGMVSPYAGGSEGFVSQWKGLQSMMDGRFYWGSGYGADTNGLGAQGGPRGGDVKNPVTYPFKGMGGVTIDKQKSGERVYDINTDGVAHYGLYPDWIEDLKKIAGDTIVTDLQRGPEAYLLMWERANGITNDACRQPELRRPASDFEAIKAGTSADEVLTDYGQPHLRRANTYRYCALNGKKEATVTVSFESTKVTGVSTGKKTGSDKDDSGDDNAAGPDKSDDNGATTPQIDNGSESPAAVDEPENKASGALPGTGGPGFGNLLGGLLALGLGIALIVNSRRFRLKMSATSLLP